MIENIGAYSQVDYDRGYQQGRADAIRENLFKDCELCGLKLTQVTRINAIDECINIIKQNKNLFITDRLCDDLISDIKQLKEQTDGMG